MLKVGVWNYYEALNKDNYFLLNLDAGIGDDLLAPFNQLYSDGQVNGVDFMTLDTIEDYNKIDLFIFFDYPDRRNQHVQAAFEQGTPRYLVIFESPLIKTDNWALENHKYFNKIFTWNTGFVDNCKYFHLPLSQNIKTHFQPSIKNTKKLCTLIAGNKSVNHPLELYSKRVEAIKWFESNHPGCFDLYGIGWDKFSIGNRYIRAIVNRIKWINAFAPKFSSYLGKVDKKKETLSHYKFSICYENAKDIPGYITEKIFDCFLAGCVPVYWGANDICDYIPKGCFIDKRLFTTYEELYSFMYEMSDKTYSQYLSCISEFLNSDLANKFSSENFANILINHCKNER